MNPLNFASKTSSKPRKTYTQNEEGKSTPTPSYSPLEFASKKKVESPLSSKEKPVSLPKIDVKTWSDSSKTPAQQGGNSVDSLLSQTIKNSPYSLSQSYTDKWSSKITPDSSGDSLWSKYKKMSERGEELSSEVVLGGLRTISSFAGGLSVFGKKVLNPVDKAFEAVFKEAYQSDIDSEDVGITMNRIVDTWDKKATPEAKNYVDQVAYGLGSSLPFLVGGIAAQATKVPFLINVIGSAGSEALVNAYDDYTAIKEKGESENRATIKAIGSFASNMALNYVTDKVGWLGSLYAPKGETLDALKKFLVATFVETGQETAQEFISNVFQGEKDLMKGLFETFLVSLPISALFGTAAVVGGPQETVSRKEETEEPVIKPKTPPTPAQIETAKKTAVEMISKNINTTPQEAENILNMAMPAVESMLRAEQKLSETQASQNEEVLTELKADTQEILLEEGESAAKEFLSSVEDQLNNIGITEDQVLEEIAQEQEEIQKTLNETLQSAPEEMNRAPMTVDELVDQTINISNQIEDQKLQGLEEYSREEVKNMVRDHINSIQDELEGFDFNITDIDFTGSRTANVAKDSSDLDVLVEYTGSSREDDLFNALNETPLEIDGIKIDINPIKPEKSGTIAEYKSLNETREGKYAILDKQEESGTIRNKEKQYEEPKEPTDQYSRGDIRSDTDTKRGEDVSTESGERQELNQKPSGQVASGERNISRSSARERSLTSIGDTVVQSIKKFESELKTAYANSGPSDIEGYTKADEALNNILSSLEIAEAGTRVKIGYGKDTEFIGVKSTFPKWIPEASRNREDLDYALNTIADITSLHYPDKPNEGKRRELFDAVLDQVDFLSGVDTKDIRNNIIQAYEKNIEAIREYRRNQKEVSRDYVREQKQKAQETEEKLVDELKEKQAAKNYTNEEIEDFVSSKTYEEDGEIFIKQGAIITDENREMIMSYVPAGGKEKKGATGKGLLDEYYTPESVVDMTVEALSAIGALKNAQSILEPSIGIGGFVSSFGKEKNITGFEVNQFTSRMAKILFPTAQIFNQPFETNFIDERGNKKQFESKYDIVIGNPPYGSHRGTFLGLGEEESIKKYEDYFIKRSLDVVKEGGHVALVVPSGFLRSTNSKAKSKIAALGELVVAYRLPNGAFETTDIGTDIVIFRKSKAEDGVAIASRAMTLSEDRYFRSVSNAQYVLGENTVRQGKFGEENAVEGTLEDAKDKFNQVKYREIAQDIASNPDTQDQVIRELEEDVYRDDVYKAENTYTDIAKEQSNPLAKTLIDIVESNGGDINSGDLALSITNEPYMNLSIERISQNEIAISHTYVQNGDLMVDPEIVFEVKENGELKAKTYEQSGIIYKEISNSDPFLATWSKNLVEQGYIQEQKAPQTDENIKDDTKVKTEQKEAPRAKKVQKSTAQEGVLYTTKKKTGETIDLASFNTLDDSGNWEFVSSTGELEGNFDKEKAYYMDGSYYNKFMYASGNIYKKLDTLEKDKKTIGDAQYKKQKALLESVLPARVDVIKLNISPLTRFAQETKLSNGKTLVESFKEFIETLPYDAFGQSSRWDIRAYVDGIPVRGADKITNNTVRKTRRIEGDRLFMDFIKEELSSDEVARINEEYNRRFNAIYIADYSKVPLTTSIHKTFKDGKDFEIRDTQRQGVGFLLTKGVGLLAHDVGLGKTSAGILTVNEMLSRGWAKKPLIVLPSSSVYEQWKAEIEAIIPDVKINLLSNLGGDFKGNLETLAIEDGTISLITEEGFKRLGFKEETYNDLTSDMADAIAKPTETARAAELQKAQIDVNIGKGKKGTVTTAYFEDLGFDHITFDEVHNYNHIIGKAKADEGKTSEFSRGFQLKPSQAGIKAWLASQYVLKNNNGRNITLLSATPFTNHPLEYYSILSLIARDRMKEMGIFNVNDFMNMFMDISVEYEFKADGSYSEKFDVRGFKNYQQLMNLVTEFIDFKDGAEAGIVRPEKRTREYTVSDTLEQKQYKRQAQELFKDKQNGGTLKAIGELRAIAFSPFLSKYSKKIPNAKEFVEGSPKIKATVELIKQNLKDNKDANQIIYSPIGVEFFPLIKKYLVQNKILGEKQIEIISGSTAKAKRQTIQEQFNKGNIKLIIGSDSIQEGINLQTQTTDIYILSLPWNFTALRQVIGRLWRYGNKFPNVRINNMFTENSLDIFLSQKLQNKQKRYDELLAFKGDYVDISDIDFEEIKFDLITDPIERVRLEGELKKQELEGKIAKLQAEVAFKNRKASKYIELEDTVRKYEEYAKETPYGYHAKYVDEKRAELAEMETTLKEKGIDIESVKQNLNEVEAEVTILKSQLEALNRETTQKIKEAIPEMPEAEKVTETDYNSFISSRSEENQDFFEGYPLFSRRSGNIKKNQAAIDELSTIFINEYLSQEEYALWYDALHGRKLTQEEEETFALMQRKFEVFQDEQYGANSVYFSKLTTSILEQLKGKDLVSKQYIFDLTKQTGVKQAEKDAILTALMEFPEGKVYVPQFLESVQRGLLELKPKILRGINTKYDNINVNETKRDTSAKYEEVIHEAPFATPIASAKHFRDLTENYFAHERIEKTDKIQKVIEIQSDLFQKGTLQKEVNYGSNKIASELEFENFMEEEDAFYEIQAFLVDQKGMTEQEAEDWIGEHGGDEQYDAVVEEFKQNIITEGKKEIKAREDVFKSAFPYRNTWYELIIRQRIQSAALDGYKYVYYPTGKNAMEIEGLGKADSFKLFKDGSVIQATAENISVGAEIAHTADILRDLERSKYIITNIKGEGIFEAVSKSNTQVGGEKIGAIAGGMTKSVRDIYYNPNYVEEFNISGYVDTKNPIYNFYEKTIPDYLNKIKTVERVTDKYGREWWQVHIMEQDKNPVLAFSRLADLLDQNILEAQQEAGTVEETKALLADIESRFNIKIPAHFVEDIFASEDITDKARGAYLNYTLFFAKNDLTRTTGFHELVHFFDANWKQIKAFEGLDRGELYKALNNGEELSQDPTIRKNQLFEIREKLAELGEIYYKDQQKASLIPQVVKDFFERARIILNKLLVRIGAKSINPDDMFRIMYYYRQTSEQVFEFKANQLADMMLSMRNGRLVADFSRFTKTPTNTKEFSDYLVGDEKHIAKLAGGTDIIKQTLDIELRNKVNEATQKIKADVGVKLTQKGTITNEQIDNVMKFIDDIGPAFFDDVSLDILKEGKHNGFYNYKDNVVSLFIKNIEKTGYGLDRIAIHELWHSLARFLPEKYVKAINEQYESEYASYLKKNPWFAAFNKNGSLTEDQINALIATFPEYTAQIRAYAIPEQKGTITKYKLAYDKTNYRFKNIDEWFVETMTDKSFSRFATMNQEAKSVFAHIKNIFAKAIQAIHNIFGTDTATKVFNLFVDRKIALEIQRKVGLGGSPSLKYFAPENWEAQAVPFGKAAKATEEFKSDDENITRIKKDINWAHKVFGQSRDIYLSNEKEFKVADDIQRIGDESRMEKRKLDQLFASILEPYMTLPKKLKMSPKVAYDKVDKALADSDLEVVNYTERQLKNRLLNDHEIRAYQAVRKSFNIAYEMLLEKMEERGITADEIAEYRSQQAGYLPHKWPHKYNVKTFDLSDQARELGIKYEDVLQRIKNGEHIEDIQNEGLLRVAMKESYPSEKQARTEAAKLLNTGTIAMSDIDASLRVDFFSQQYINFEKMKNVIANSNAPLDVQDGMIDAVRDMFKEKGFGRHYMRRYNIKGYQQNELKRVIADYFSGFTGYLTKIDRGIGYYNTLSNIDERRQPRLYDYMINLIAYDMGSTNDDRNPLKTAAYVMFLVNDVSYLAMNATQNLIVGAGELSKIIKSPTLKALGPEALLIKAIADYGVGNITPEEKKIINELLRLGRLGGEQASEFMGFKNNPLYNNISWGITKALYWSTEVVERNINRIPAFLAAYRVLTSQGTDSETAVTQALTFSEDVHFRFGKHNRPQFLRGKVANTVFVFISYSRALMFNLIRDMKKGEVISLSRKLFWTVALGGVMSLPLYGFFDVLKHLFGDDSDDEMQQEISRWEILIKRGLPAALAQIDMSGRLGLEFMNINAMIERPSDAKSYLGAIGSLFMPDIQDPDAAGRVQKAIVLFYQKRFIEGFGYALPDFLGNPFKAYAGYTQGVNTFAGTELEDADGRAFKYNRYEAIIKALGFTPTRESIAWDAKRQEIRATQDLQSKRTNIKRTVQGYVKRGEIDIARDIQDQAMRDGIISETTDYIKEYGMGQFIETAYDQWQKSSKRASDKRSMEKYLIDQIYEGNATEREINEIRRDVEFYTTFGIENETANAVRDASTTSKKVQALLAAQESMTKSEFETMYSQMRNEFTLESGRKSNVLLSDAVDKAFKETEPIITSNAGKEKSEKSIIDQVVTYADAIKTDPVTAFNRIFTGQVIRRVDSGAIIVERMDLEDSQKIKTALNGNVPELKLDHTIPLQLGGSNAKSNLKLVSTDEWKSYTPVENYLGKLLRNGSISKDKAQNLIKDFKSGKITEAEIYKIK